MRRDADLLVAARTDAGAFRELYERYATRIYGYHLRRSKDPSAAHDLTAETFAQAWLARARFRDEVGGTAGPWLFGIARHVLLASVRQRRMELAACERLGVLSAVDREAAPVPRGLGSYGREVGAGRALERVAETSQLGRKVPHREVSIGWK
ncbi:MAG: hypothetical protein QOC86_2961 [Gaiellales bacterium]|nr:hypothetical protein [Gaiellales bacterium]